MNNVLSLFLCIKQGLTVGVLAILGSSSILHAQGSWSDEFDRPGLYTGWILAVGEYQGELIAGGNGFFEGDGHTFGQIARFDGTHWQPIGSGILNGKVTAIGEYQGELIVGGQFNDAGGQLVGNVASWNGTQWSPLGTGLDDLIHAFTVFRGELYAAGEFTKTGGGTLVNHIARWDGVQWRPVGTGIDKALDPEVWALSVGPDDRLYASGQFDTAGGAPAFNVAVWDGIAWGSVGGGLPGPQNGIVYDQAWYQGKLYASGNFDLISGGSNMEKVAGWDGVSWSAAGVFPDTQILSEVRSLEVFGGSLYAGGNFSEASGADAMRIARFDGTQWNFAGGVQDVSASDVMIQDMTEVGGKLIVGGNFFWAGFNYSKGEGAATDNVASFDENDWASVGNGLGFDGHNHGAVLWNGNPVVVGGNFLQAGSQLASPPVLFEGTDWIGLGDFSEFSGRVNAAIVFEGDLVVAGEFISVDGTPVNDVARYDGATWTGFGASPLCCGVDALAVYQGKLYAAGLGGVMRWTGSTWQSFAPQIFGSIQTMAVHQQVLYIGGSMSSFGNLVSWDGSVQQTVGGGTNGIVYALESFNGKLIMGGAFSSAGGVSTNRLARWDGNSFIAFPGIAGTQVTALGVFQDELYVGGELFQQGSPMKHIARWASSVWEPLGTGLDGAPWALVADEASGYLWVAGGFGHANGRPSRNFARWEVPVIPILELVPPQLSASTGFVTATINFPDSEAGINYALLASRTGTGPTNLRGLDVPLTADGLFNRMLTGWSPPMVQDAFGTLDLVGDGQATIASHPSLIPFVGQSIWLAVVTFDPDGRMSSEAVALPIVF